MVGESHPIATGRRTLEWVGVLSLLGSLAASIGFYLQAYLNDFSDSAGDRWEDIGFWHWLLVPTVTAGIFILLASRVFFRWENPPRTLLTAGTVLGTIAVALTVVATGGGALVALARALDEEFSANAADALASVGAFVAALGSIPLVVMAFRTLRTIGPRVPLAVPEVGESPIA